MIPNSKKCCGSHLTATDVLVARVVLRSFMASESKSAPLAHVSTE